MRRIREKVLIVGQARARGSESTLGPDTASGRRMRRLVEDFDLRFEVVNLIDRFPGKAGKGDAFPMAEAREAAERLGPKLGGRRVLLLGGNVARAFGLGRRPIMRWEGGLAVFPHPSGVSHWWNDPRNVEAAKDFLDQLKTSQGRLQKTASRGSISQVDGARSKGPLQFGAARATRRHNRQLMKGRGRHTILSESAHGGPQPDNRGE